MEIRLFDTKTTEVIAMLFSIHHISRRMILMCLGISGAYLDPSFQGQSARFLCCGVTIFLFVINAYHMGRHFGGYTTILFLIVLSPTIFSLHQ